MTSKNSSNNNNHEDAHKVPILLFGAGGHAKVVVDILEKQGKYRIVGVVDPFYPGKEFLGYPLLMEGPALERAIKGIVAIGDNWKREKIVHQIRLIDSNFEFIVAVHPSAQLARDVVIGQGSVVMAGVCINTDTQIGAHCIINTRVSVDHDNRIGDFVSLAPGCTLGGSVKVGSFSSLGLGVHCIHKINIGEHTVIGAGAVVIRDVPGEVVGFGNPYRVFRSRERGESYL